VDLIRLAQDREMWWAVVRKVLNLLVPYEASREGLSYLSTLTPMLRRWYCLYSELSKQRCSQQRFLHNVGKTVMREYARAGQHNLVCGAGSCGKNLVCMHDIQYTERRMNKYSFNFITDLIGKKYLTVNSHLRLGCRYF
jgi:hypothetical protein